MPLLQLIEHYRRLRDSDPRAFVRRAGSVLGRLRPDSASRDFDPNPRGKLGQLFFVQSAEAWLAAPEYLRDLLESPALEVQALALRVQARAASADNFDLVVPLLLCRLSRRVLSLVCAVASQADTLETARVVRDKARDALSLPRPPAQREELIALLGKLLHRWPQLCGPRETPLVHAKRLP
jgi:hypothetical protein